MVSVSSDGRRWHTAEQDSSVQGRITLDFSAADFAVNMEADWVDEENEDEVHRAVVCVKPARWYQNSVRIIFKTWIHGI